jgi:hypothetical protein
VATTKVMGDSAALLSARMPVIRKRPLLAVATNCGRVEEWASSNGDPF